MKRNTVTIGLRDPQSPVNVGAALRAAGCYRADAILYSGDRYDRAARYHTDTQNAQGDVRLEHVESLLDAVPEGAAVVAVELVEGAIPLPEFEHPDSAFYIFGSEDGDVGKKIAAKADAVVYIPTVGCLNLAQTVNVVLYDRLAKCATTEANDALIRRSQSNNNNLNLHRIRSHEARIAASRKKSDPAAD